MLIPFTQYLRPNGRTRAVKWECTNHEQEVKAQALLDLHAVFECEQLQTGDVSLTCELKDNEGEMQTLAHEIVPNNQEVVEAVVRLVERAHKTVIENSISIE